MADEIAKLNLRHKVDKYLVVVFENAVNIAQQPGSNLILGKQTHEAARLVYDADADTWDYDALGQVIAYYKRHERRRREQPLDPGEP